MSRYNDDLISRKAAINVADGADYAGLSIEDVKKVTDEVVKELRHLPSAEQWIPCSERLPTTADVVEVVRCEKCTYGYIYPNNFNGYCRKRRNMVYANDFCSKGERIEERGNNE